MQSLSWYRHRLHAMSFGEVWWRLAGAARNGVDALRLRLDAFPSDARIPALGGQLAVPAPPRLCDVAVGEWRLAVPGTCEHAWRERLVAAADDILGHRITVFQRRIDLGTPIDWNRDHGRGLTTPMTFSARIDYRDVRIAGDAKIVWEPNRHHHLVVLARAYRATGDRRYASEAIEQLTSWLDQCPVLRGMNWRSPLELAIRLINWTWTIDLVRDSGCVTPEFSRRFIQSVHLHLWEITRKFSKGSSANNHLIGEAAGTFVASCYFQDLEHASRWRDESFEILTREIVAQTHDDGGTREQAFAYHLFVAQLLLVAGLAGRRTGHDFGAAYWSRLERMLEFAAVLTEAGPMPLVGDGDDGYVLDLGRDGITDLPALFAVAAALFARSEFKERAGSFHEPARWLLPSNARGRFEEIAVSTAGVPLRSRALESSGYYLLQSGTRGSADSISAVVDCGPLGFTALAAHGHADALSVTVRAFGVDVLVDPGTFDYFTYPAWRAYFRGTAAHNTVVVDRLDQSEQLGLFLWGARAEARSTAWQPALDGGVVAGEHDGYRRLRDPVVHRRSVELRDRRLTIRDQLTMREPHEIGVSFHLAEDCEVVTGVGDDGYRICLGTHLVRMRLDPKLTATFVRGSEQPIAGWVSRGYHQRRPAASITGTVRAAVDIVLECQFEFEPDFFAEKPA